MKYDLKRPCRDCPFRTDVGPYLNGARAQEIARSIAEGSDFPCHKTTADTEDENGVGDREATSDSQMCAGALIMMEKQGTPNQLMRIMGRLGVYDHNKLDMSAPVCSSTVAFVAHHSKSLSEWATGTDPDEDEDSDVPDSCHVCGPGCEAPAGHMVNGSAIPTVGPFDTTQCPTCGEWTCGVCWEELPDGRVLCTDCAEYERPQDDEDDEDT